MNYISRKNYVTVRVKADSELKAIRCSYDCDTKNLTHHSDVTAVPRCALIYIFVCIQKGCGIVRLRHWDRSEEDVIVRDSANHGVDL